MGVWEITKLIWELPWYKVLLLAVVDDVIATIKLWPFWLGIIILILILVFLHKE